MYRTHERHDVCLRYGGKQMKARRPKKKQKQDRMDVVVESEEVDKEPIKDQPQPSWRGISDSHQREGMKMAQMGRGRAQRMITKQS